MSLDEGKLYLSWRQVEIYCWRLATHLKAKGITQLVGIARGGLPIVTMVAQMMDVRDVHTITLASYSKEGEQSEVRRISASPFVYAAPNQVAFIDDICDTGNTMKWVAQQWPDAFLVAVIGKPAGMTFTDAVAVSVPQDQWVVFPWEHIQPPNDVQVIELDAPDKVS